MKYLFLFPFLCISFTGIAQFFYGYEIQDYLIDAVHPYGCNDNYVIGLPDDSTWVNFDAGDVMTGTFGMTWTNGDGNDLLLETSYHADNYRVRLLLTTGLYSAFVDVNTWDWTQIPDTSWVHIFTSCSRGEIPASRWLLPLDFTQFGLTTGDVVSGIQITFLSTNGSPDLAGVYIIAKPCAILNLGTDSVICDGTSILLNADTPNATYLWQDSSMNPTFTVTKPGTYWVRVTLDECITVDTIHIAEQLILVDIGNDTTLCPGETLQLNPGITGASYHWQDNSDSPTFIVTSPGTYWVSVMIGDCVESDTIEINYTVVPPLHLGNDTVLCEGDTLLLNAAISGATFLWQDNSTDSTLLVSQPDTYWVNVNVDDCLVVDTIDINYVSLPLLDLGPDSILCEGETILLGASFQDAMYQWQDDSDQPIFEANQSGSYWVEVTVGPCVIADTIHLEYKSMVLFNLGNDTTICEPHTLMLDPMITEEVSYVWQDNSENKTYIVHEPGSYWLQVENVCGVSVDTISVSVENCSCEFYIPNVFTPNGDLVNDLLIPSATCDISDFLFMIFDRAGNQFFVTHHYGEGWDGTFRSQLAQSGVYAYVIVYSFTDGRKGSVHGDITLIR